MDDNKYVINPDVVEGILEWLISLETDPMRRPPYMLGFVATQVEDDVAYFVARGSRVLPSGLEPF